METKVEDVRNVEGRVQAIVGGSGRAPALEFAIILRGATVCHGV